jgi:hypothetical protein
MKRLEIGCGIINLICLPINAFLFHVSGSVFALFMCGWCAAAGIALILKGVTT